MTIDASKEVHQSDADRFCIRIRIHEYRKFRVRTDDGKDHVFENANDAIRFAIENKIFPLGVTMDAIMSAVLEGDAIKRLAAERDAQTARADAAETDVARLNAELRAMRASQDALVAAAYEAAAQWHIARIAEMNAQIAENNEYMALHGLTDSGGNAYCRDSILNSRIAVKAIRALTTADATAALDASRAAHDCHQPDLVTAAQSLRITGPNSDGEYWLHINASGMAGGINLGSEHGICKRLLDAASSDAALDLTPAPAVEHRTLTAQDAARVPEIAALPEVQALIRQAVEAEREACAKEADRIADKYWRPLIVTRSDSEAAVDEGKMDAAFEVAAAIRKREEV